jgi:hypothetical protein
MHECSFAFNFVMNMYTVNPSFAFWHFVFSQILHTFCTVLAKYPNEHCFRNCTPFCGGPIENVKSGLYCIWRLTFKTLLLGFFLIFLPFIPLSCYWYSIRRTVVYAKNNHYHAVLCSCSYCLCFLHVVICQQACIVCCRLIIKKGND